MLVKINKKTKDKLFRQKYLNSELKRRYYKFMRTNSKNQLDAAKYSQYQKKLAMMPRVRFTNYCYLTGRAKGGYREFKLSRHQIREKFKFLHGLTNSSW